VRDSTEREKVSQIPLRPLHSNGSLSQPKLAGFRRLSTDELVDSLRPGKPGGLKARPDGTIMEGHHRVCVLRECGLDVDDLPREIVEGWPPDEWKPR
jgi:hypothetical protein